MYNSEANLNKADAVIYIRDDIIESTEIIIIDKLQIVNSHIKMSNAGRTEITVLYRSHKLPKLNLFIVNKGYWLKIILKNNYIIGDYNIVLL